MHVIHVCNRQVFFIYLSARACVSSVRHVHLQGNILCVARRFIYGVVCAMEGQEDTKTSGSTGVVDLNVGGQLYTTSMPTLAKDPHSLLSVLFNGSQRQCVPKDSRGRFFIDRDGILFRYVLDFLRNLSLTLPDGFTELDRLLLEAEHFKIVAMKEALIKAIKTRKNEEKAKKRASGYLSVCVRGTYAFGRDGVADVKFRKLQRILVCGNVALAREVFGDSLNETRDPAREEVRYTNRFYLKYNHLEKAFDQLAEKGFQMMTSCAGGAGYDPESEETKWNHFNDYIFYRGE